MSFLDFEDVVVREAVDEAKQFIDKGRRRASGRPRVIDIKYRLGRDFEGDRVAWIWIIVPDSTKDSQLRGRVLDDLSEVVIEALGKRTTKHMLDIMPIFSFRKEGELRELQSGEA